MDSVSKSKILRISIKRAIAPYLALRASADRLFDRIESSKSKEVVVDFSGIAAVTRSFAHQYAIRKQSSQKSISEIKVPSSIKSVMVLSTKPVHVATVACKSVKPMRLLL
jgi:hypothetical protein